MTLLFGNMAGPPLAQRDLPYVINSKYLSVKEIRPVKSGRLAQDMCLPMRTIASSIKYSRLLFFVKSNVFINLNHKIMIYAYIRVSTEMQNYDSQKFEIQNYCSANGLSVDRWVSESISGTIKVEKRSLGKTIRKMKAGDKLICTELSRLGRNMLMVMSVLNTCSSKGISIHSIKDNFDLSENINSKIIAFAFALAAEIERNLISQRTKEALALRKAAGIKLGRPPGKSRKKENAYKSWDAINQKIKEGIPLSEIARQYKIHRNTLRNYMNEKESYSTANGAGVEKPEI